MSATDRKTKMDKHIDDVQPATVDEHFQLILDDRTTIDTDYGKVSAKDLPHWFDERLFRTGQRYHMNNLLALSVAQTSGLVAILCVPDIIEVLEYTGKSETVFLSFRRYAETLLLMFDIARYDILAPESKYFKAMNTIRYRHVAVSKRRMKQGLNAIYQKDMAITMFGFIGFVMGRREHLGLAHSTDEEREGFAHFWRVTAHLLGISDRINLVRKTVAETTELCKRVSEDIIAKHMLNNPPGFEKLAGNAVDGLFYVDVMLDKDAFFELTYELTGVKYPKELSWYSYFNHKQRLWTLYLCDVPYVGAVLRTAYNYFLLGLIWMLVNCPIIPRLKYGAEGTNLCVYAKA